MTAFEKIEGKIQSAEQLAGTLARWRAAGDIIVFTNGCFDL
ncbi:MAG: D-glycero-beta-D-manno-heptose 1-phosphate adenylyltransferase, partial [Saprospiraceae bacterium]|nr:D-glycero-beta-D-manno-heptose 1-phosphate adenylyltransferase [Saprospiraceae bacterium]